MDHTNNYPCFDMYFANNDKTRFLIRHVEENLVSEKYNCEVIYDEEYRRILEKRYNYSEVIKIPKELFSREKGLITFFIEVEIPRVPNQEMIRIMNATVFYKVEGERVILSTRTFE